MDDPFNRAYDASRWNQPGVSESEWDFRHRENMNAYDEDDLCCECDRELLALVKAGKYAAAGMLLSVRMQETVIRRTDIQLGFKP
jgi:hypothetical protein